MKDYYRKVREYLTRIYGMDALSCGLLLLSVLVYIPAALIPGADRRPVGLLLYIPLIVCIFRFFSTHIEKRQLENDFFCHLIAPLLDRLDPQDEENRKKRAIKKEEKERKKEQKAQEKERNKTFRFFDCPVCKQHLRVPRGNGKVEISCPNCGHRFIRKT